jgi:hypothetical protein
LVSLRVEIRSGVLQHMQRMGYPKQRRKEGLCVERHAWPCDHLSIVLCNLLHAYRDAYLVMDGLYKLGVPTPDAMPLLLAIMSHLMDGLDIRPRKPALHANIISTPPSQLIKLAVALKVPNCLLYALHMMPAYMILVPTHPAVHEQAAVFLASGIV